MCTKLEKKSVQHLLSDYDIIALNEVKTSLLVLFPGYKSYRSNLGRAAERGGTVVLVKNWLSELVFEVDTSIVDQVWLKLRNVPGVTFGFCYIPPPDSQYYSLEAFSSIGEKLQSEYMPNGYVIVGDMNTRFGRSVSQLLVQQNLTIEDGWSYPEIPDDVNISNDNADLLSALCVDNSMVVVNNLKYQHRHFPGNKTFRRRDTWISEIDTCIVTHSLIPYVSDFSVMQRGDLPSDHAPITLNLARTGVDLDGLFSRATMLGDHAVLYGSSKKNMTRKPLKFVNIDKDLFVNNISQRDTSFLNECVDISECEKSIVDTLYDCAQESTQGNEILSANEVNLGRWERLLNDRDDARVWKAIDWRGNVNSEDRGEDALCPSSEDFKAHLEAVLNPEDVDPGGNEITTNVTIPVLDEPISPAEVYEQIKKLHPDRACGPDGLPPGVLSVLPVQWILTLVTLFNNIFLAGVYHPVSWTKAKMFMIFKRR